MKSKTKIILAIALFLIVIVPSIGVLYYEEPAQISPNSSFLTNDLKYSNTKGFGPYLYQNFELGNLTGGSRLVLTQLEFAGYGDNHSMIHNTTFTFSSSNPTEEQKSIWRALEYSREGLRWQERPETHKPRK